MKRRSTPKIQCPNQACQSWRSKVVDARPDGRDAFTRRRKCCDCGTVFKTIEQRAA